MTKWIVSLWSWLLRLFRRDQPAFRFTVVLEEPELPQPNRIYLVGDEGRPWKGVLLCPCGCGDLIELNLSPPGPPLWRVERIDGQRITMHPSIWRTAGCRSHFWIRDGEIVWCE